MCSFMALGSRIANFRNITLNRVAGTNAGNDAFMAIRRGYEKGGYICQ